MCNRAAPYDVPIHNGCLNAAVSIGNFRKRPGCRKDRIGNCGDDRRSPGLALRGELLILFLLLCTSARSGLGGCPVCGPVAVAEDLFTRMRCELDHYRPTRYTEQFDADVDDCST